MIRPDTAKQSVQIVRGFKKSQAAGESISYSGEQSILIQDTKKQESLQKQIQKTVPDQDFKMIEEDYIKQTVSIGETSFLQKSNEKPIEINHECRFNENMIRDLIEDYREEWQDDTKWDEIID